MTPLILAMLAINATLICIMLPRIYGDWLRFGSYRENGEDEMLQELLFAENQWVKRHFVCAVAAVILVAAMRRQPALRGSDQLADVTATYALISLLFAFTESLFAQKIANARGRLGAGGPKAAIR